MKPIGPKNERAAIITGAGSGLDRAIAKELVEAGIRCVITGRRRAALEQTADIIAGDRSRVLVVQGDVTAREDRARVLASAWKGLAVSTFGEQHGNIKRRPPA
jgi:NADP-dependent 3-hydroxy acid dehydrogenase YdfG